MKQLMNGAIVRLHSTSSDELNGLVCRVVGYAGTGLYIVEFPRGFVSPSYHYDVITMVESCLEIVYSAAP